jgi:hypothetical protein
MTGYTPGEVVFHNGHTFIVDDLGMWIPAISGGRAPDPRRRTAEDDTDDDASDDDDDNKTFTQADLNRIMANERRTFEKKLRGLEVKLENQGSQFAELMGALEEYVGDEAQGGDADEEDEDAPPARERVPSSVDRREPTDDRDAPGESPDVRTLKSRIKRMEREQEQMRETLQQEREAREQSEMMRLETERDASLVKELQAAKCVSVEGGLRHFREMLRYNPEKERWYFIEPDTGAPLEIKEGVSEYMPDYLKESPMKRGGSGGRGSSPAAAALAQKQSEVARLKDQAEKSPTNTNIQAYRNAQRSLTESREAVGAGATAGNPNQRQNGMGPMRRGAPGGGEDAEQE